MTSGESAAGFRVFFETLLAQYVPGGTPGNSCWGVPPGSQDPDAISDQKCHFP